MTTKRLRDFIARYESGGDYNIVWGGIRKADHPPRPLVTMTIRDVLAWQDRIDPKYNSEAAGKYQVMEDTLRGIYTKAGLFGHSLFDEENQDRLADALLRRRGLDRYLSGSITTEEFANAIAREWASMPVVTGPNRGRSYYAGDGLNKAHAGVSEFLAAVRSVRGQRGSYDGIEVTPPARGFWAALVAALAKWVGR